MAVAQWKSLRSLDTIQQSMSAANANLWLGQQGTTGISKFQLQLNSLEIVVELELADIDPKHLEVKLSPDMLILSGIRYQIDPVSVAGNAVSQSDSLYQPSSFRDLIPLPDPVVPEAATATLNGQLLKITLPKATATEALTSTSVYHHPSPLAIRSTKPLERGGMSDLLVPNYW